VAELEVRALRPEDTERVLDLLRSSLGAGTVPRTRAFWEWKHLENPFGASPGLVALHGEDLVGLRVFLRWRWRFGGEDLGAVRAVDTATHPEWQGRGIFRRLTETLVEELRAEGVAFVFNTPNSKSRAGYLKMGWRDLGRQRVHFRPAGLGVLFGGRSAGAQDDATPLAGHPKVEELLRRDDLGELLEACDRGDLVAGALRTARSVEYLTWRYGRCPEHDYRALWDLDARSGPGGGAALVFRSRLRRGRREIALSEILVGSGAEARLRARALLRRVQRTPGGDYLIGLAAAGSPERQVLARSGFWLTLPGPRLTVRPLAAAAPDRAALAGWRLSAGDLELF
jgi:GNAT superfamily N-acetyltransferase